MNTNLQAVINLAADEADSLLDGVATPAEARPVLMDWLADNHPSLRKAEHLQIVSGVLALLEREGFFTGTGTGGGGGAGDPAEADEPDE